MCSSEKRCMRCDNTIATIDPSGNCLCKAHSRYEVISTANITNATEILRLTNVDIANYASNMPPQLCSCQVGFITGDKKCDTCQNIIPQCERCRSTVKFTEAHKYLGASPYAFEQYDYIRCDDCGAHKYFNLEMLVCDRCSNKIE